jgi:hypothetical protein
MHGRKEEKRSDRDRGKEVRSCRCGDIYRLREIDGFNE